MIQYRSPKVYDKLMLRKITETVATRCHISKPKCPKFDLAGTPPQTPLVELTALFRPLAGFKGPTSKGREMTLPYISNRGNLLIPIARCERKLETDFSLMHQSDTKKTWHNLLAIFCK